MKQYIRFAFIICPFALLFIISSCEKKSKREALTASEVDSLSNTFMVIQDSLAITWNKMIEDDNQKIADAKRLLEEVSYTNQYDVVQYDTLQQKLVQLLQMRYDNTTMADPFAIDNYDSASNKVINEIIALATAHPDYNRYPLMKSLIKDIQEANGRVLRQRVNYDYAAKHYNQFLEDNKEVLEEIDSLDSLEKKPLFEISG